MEIVDRLRHADTLSSDRLQREIARTRGGGNLVAAFVDVDDLKSVNDERGHHAGDELLRNVADGLRSHMRS